MKKILLSFLIVSCFNLKLSAQINLNLHGGFGNNFNTVSVQAYACQPNQFNIVMSATAPIIVQPGDSLYFRIIDFANIEFPNLLTHLNDTNAHFYEIFHNDSSVAVSYTLNNFLIATPMIVSCDLIKTGTSQSVSHGIGLYLNGNIGATISGDFNGNAITTSQISYNVFFPYLSIQNPSTPLLVDYLTVRLPNNRVERIMSYVNSGGSDPTTDMQMSFVFSDTLQCRSFQFDSIYYYIDGGSPISIPITVNDTVISTFVNTIQIKQGQVLHVKEVITLKDNGFLLGCSDEFRTLRSNLNWGCSTLCLNISDEARIERGNLRPNLTLNRITPANTATINFVGHDSYWDTLFSQQAVTNYTFRLANRGVNIDIINNVRFAIIDALSSSMYFVADTNSIIISPSFLDWRNYRSFVTPYSSAAKKPSCVLYNYPNAVREFEFYIDYLMPNDSIDITVPLIYCCPDRDNGIDTSAINLFENDKRLNTWGVVAQGRSDSLGSNSPANTTLSNGYLNSISGGQFSLNDATYREQLYLRQDFSPNGITFSVPKDSICSSFTSLALNNYRFNQRPDDAYLFEDANIFTKSYSSVATDTVRVDSLFLQFQIKTEPGLRLDNLVTNYTVTSPTHSWVASQISVLHSDSCSLSNIYTITFSSANFPFLNPAVPFLKEVYDLVGTGNFNFNIKGCCCNNGQSNNPNYIIETRIAGYDHCFIPMYKVLGNSEIHCPGCNMPGTIVLTPDEKILERTNFGYIDANDNGLADSTLVRIDSAYIALHRANMDINHSMVGDTLSSTMQVRIDDTSIISLASLAAQNIFLTHLYAEQKIERSNSSEFDLHPFKLTITARNQSVTITQTSGFWNQIVKDVRDSIRSGAKYDIIFYNLSANLLGNIFGISNYVYNSNEEITLQVNLKVCKNFQMDRDSKRLGDNQFSSKVSLNMYLTDVNLDSLHIYDAFTHPNRSYPVAQDTGVVFPNELYMCETRSAMHYFYSIYAKSFTSVYEDPNLPCVRRLSIEHEIAIGGEKVNPFRTEFRPIPEFLPIVVSLPTGINNYRFYSNGTGLSNVRTYYTTTCGIPSLHLSTTASNLVFSQIIANTHTLATESLLTNAAFPLTCGSPFNVVSNAFYSSDEFLKQTLSFPFTYTVCSSSAFALIDSSRITTNLQVTTCSSNSISVLSKVNPDHRTITTNYVRDFQVSTPLAVNAIQNRVGWKLEVANPNGNDRLTRNLFIYFADTSAYTNIDVINSPPQFRTLPNGKRIVFFELGNMNGALFNFADSIYVNINNCSLRRIPFTIGFDCIGYPTNLQIQNGTICQLDTGSLNLNIEEPRVTATIEQNVSITTCQIDTITTKCKSLGSNVNGFRFKLDKLNSFTQLISERILRYHNGSVTSDSIRITNAVNSNHYEFEPIIAYDNLTRGDSLEFDVVYSLFDTTTTQPFIIDFEYTNLCGDLGPSASQDTALISGGFNCVMGIANCFQVMAAQSTINCAGDTITINSSIIGNNTGLSYQWSSIPTGTNDTTRSIHPMPSAATTYTVVATDASGNTSSASVTVNPILGQCCIPAGFSLTNGDLLLNNTSSSAFIQQYSANTISTLSKILIVGTFTVDSNFAFVGCTNLIMAPGALINVLPFVQFIVDDSHMFSCGNMSRGINAQANSSVRMKGSVIEDAQYAVNLGPKAEMRSVANHFKNNYISINAVSTLPANTPMNIQLNISNTVFESTDSLLPKYTGQTPIPISHPLAGIFLNNITNVSINPDTGNTFRNMNVGILAYRTNLSVSHCTFKDILKYDAYQQAPRLLGSAIYTRGSLSAYTLTFIGQHDSLQADFENCIYGIRALSMSIGVSNSYLKNVDIGIELERSNLADATVKYNTIECNLTGISLLNNLYASSLVVYSNEIRGGHAAFQNAGTSSSTTGIDLQGNNFSQFGGRHLVAANTIHLGDYGHTGIHLNYSKFFDVVENSVTLENDRNTNMVGIAIENTEQSIISCNEIDGTRSNQSMDFDEAAIRYTSSLGNVIGQNAMNFTSQGIDVIGVCDNGFDQTTIEKNLIGFHFNGLRYHGSAVVNEQLHNGNRWISPFNYPGKGALNLDTLNALNFQYIVQGSGQSVPSNWAPSFWFFVDSLNPDKQLVFSDCDNFGTANPNPVPSLLKLSSDSFKTIEYQQELNWQSKVNVYQKLIEHPEYLSYPDLADFYALNAATSIHYVAKLGVERAKLLANQTTLVQNIENNSIDIYEKSEILKQIYLEIEKGNLKEGEKDSLLQLSDELMVELDQSIQLNDFYVDQLKNSIKNKTDLIGQLTDSIMGTEIYEINEEQINGIESYIYDNPQDDSLVQFEYTLTSIATQCPLSGGVAVFKARAILKGINPNISYDDASTCIQGGIVYRKKEVANQYCNLYPNPTSGTISISYSIPNDATLIVTDAIGRAILQTKINSQSTSSTFDLSKYQTGLYFYRMCNDSDVRFNGKIILTK